MRHYDKLDRAIDARRLDLDLSWKELAEKAALSDVSMRNFRKGRSEPNSLSKRRIEDALVWHHGSVDDVLDGGEPKAKAIPDADRIREARQQLVDAVGLDNPAEMREALSRALTTLNELIDGN